MHLSCWRAGHRLGISGGKQRTVIAPWIWFFRWGFSLWIGTFHFSIGHDTRGRVVVLGLGTIVTNAGAKTMVSPIRRIGPFARAALRLVRGGLR